MKIRCTKFLDSDGRPLTQSNSLTIGRVYHVMEIFIEPDGRSIYNIIFSERRGEWPKLGLFVTECFEIISDVIPSNWEIKINPRMLLLIAPTEWHDPKFLESFHDRDPAALSIFQRARDVILAEDP